MGQLQLVSSIRDFLYRASETILSGSPLARTVTGL